MDAKLWFWTGALAILGASLACGARGLRAIRRGDVRSHRSLMLAAASGVPLFLLAYAGKVLWLGREDRSAWTALDHAVLYTHELCVAAMIAAGSVALYRAWRFRGHLAPGPSLPDRPLPGSVSHRRAGRIAAWAGVLALLTAGGVWAGMLARAGTPM